MAQINHREGYVVTAQKIGILSIESYQQASEFINPGKAAFAGKAVFVYGFIKQSFRTTLRFLAIALVFLDVRNDVMIEAGLARSFSVKSRVSIEIRTSHLQPDLFHLLDSRLQMLF